VSRQVDAVVFDIGGVLLDWNPRYLYQHLFDDPAELDDFLARVCTSEWHATHDLGADTLTSCQALAREHPDYASQIMAWADRREEMISGQIEGTVAILDELRSAGVPCFVLSNMEADAFAVRRDRYPFFGWVDGCVISGIEKVAKPDARIFEIMIERFGLDPARTAFIDDQPRNIAAARALGLVALRFESPPALRTELRGLGLPL
jgi:2-haloacid dehalogenase